MTIKAYAYYPGCALHGTAREYNTSTLLVCQALGIDLQEIPGWTCCGASSAHASSHLLSLVLPARNLKLAGSLNLPVAVPCAMCFSRLKAAQHELKDPATYEEVSQIVGDDLQVEIPVESLLQVLAPVAITPQKSLQGLKVACYYGCLLVRPQKVTQLDDEENPQIMDRLLQQVGAETIDWGMKTECCGAGMPLARPDMVLRLSYRLLSYVKRKGAEALAVACPLCHYNLDGYQKDMEAKFGEKVDLPVFYFTQLLGLALGFSPRELLLDKHFTDPLPLLRSKGLA